MSKLLLRHGHVYDLGDRGQAWSLAHDRWLRQLRRDASDLGWSPATTSAFDTCYESVIMVTDRRDRLDAEIVGMAADSESTPVARRLGCLRGISTLTGFGLAVEIGDWSRFTGKTIGSFVGLTPSEYSSGQSRSQGGIVKTGNSHARRLLIEAAWHHRSAYRPGKTMLDRWKLASPAARASGDAGNRRLQRQWAKVIARKKAALSRRSRSPASWPAGVGPWLSLTTPKRSRSRS